MPFDARLYHVLIASPSDMPDERQAATDAVNEWNAQHAKAEGIVLLPVRWETHAVPQANIRPQEAINQQLVQDADLLIGMFWMKLGTQTGAAESGTVEEINQIVAAGKPAMLYFSNRPVDPGNIDAKQHRRLKKFKADTLKNSLIDTFKSLPELREKLLRGMMHHARRWRSLKPGSVAPVSSHAADHNEPVADRASHLDSERSIFESRLLHGKFYRITGKRGILALTIAPVKPPVKQLKLGDTLLLKAGGDLWPIGAEFAMFESTARTLACVESGGRTAKLPPTCATEITNQAFIFAANHWLFPEEQDNEPARVIYIDMSAREPELVKSIYRYVRLLKAMGVAGPWYIGFTLLRPQNTQLIASPAFSPHAQKTFEGEEVRPDTIIIPNEAIEEADGPSTETEQAFMAALKPALDQFWMDYGYINGAKSYDRDSGRYVGLRR